MKHSQWFTRVCVSLLWLASTAGWCAQIEYAGGTLAGMANGTGGSLETADPAVLQVKLGRVRAETVPYDRINLIEYGQNASRRLVMAAVVSPLFLLSKSRRHYLTIGYRDEDGSQQAMVLRVDKRRIRSMLASLEARTGLRVQYQDDEARKGGRG
ncbi:MAG: hypothetical protein IT162_09150 [Bryobacterales bacterium]|nr:hypothetical protein [Bryobacterales bacterium]